MWISFLISADIRKLVRIHGGRDGWDHWWGDECSDLKRKKKGSNGTVRIT